VPDAKGKLPACVTQSLLWWEQSLAKLGLDSSTYIEGILDLPIDKPLFRPI
jgi:hypothetical protein